jgi:Spy/CpxP family protein refolding chaperone
MHPAFYSWWKHARGEARQGCGSHAAWAGGHGCGPRGRGEGPDARFGGSPDDFFGGGGPFGVRRPLRFLAHKLDLSEEQVAELARILDELKTERAQAEVDHRRTVTSFADAIEGAAFGEDRAREGGDLRVKSAERLREAVIKALSRIHAALEEDQRKRLAYLVRTGVLSL